MIRRYRRHTALVGSNANNALNTGPLNLNVNNAGSLSNANVGTGISLKLNTPVCTFPKLKGQTNDNAAILAGSLVTCRTSGGNDT